MKYIRRFFESIEDISVKEIKDFCNNGLAYLIDDGFNVEVSENNNSTITISIFKTEDILLFNWNDISDDFIPFIILLDEKYTLFNLEPLVKRDANITIKFSLSQLNPPYEWKHFTIDELSNNLIDKKEIRIIHIRVKI